MEVLERIWEFLGVIFGGIGRAFERTLTSLFGSSNARYIKRLQARVEAINALEPKYQALSDEDLRAQTVEFRRRLAAGETPDDILVEAFAIAREAGRRFIGLRHYDVQMIGGMVLHSGNIAEMVTGEGKTLVATLPAYLNALSGKGVHVVTVNDYLARRDMEWMGPLYMGLGLTVGAIHAGMDATEKQLAYDCDITYGTNNEFGFDYLRDNMKPAARGDERYPQSQQQAQRALHYAIVDEVDNILIDEARTPLIISGPAFDDVKRYAKADEIARRLRKDTHFEVKEKEHSAHLTDDGVREAERLAGVESFYTAGNMDWPHLIDNALKAHHLYKLDVNYVVEGDEVIIVDEFTGRKMPGRQWSDGLHQAVEAKEGVQVKAETQTYATITLQNYFKLYDKISGMTGTAMTEASEFWKIYKLDVIAIPTNRVLTRLIHPDVIYRSEREKYEAIIDEIERLNRWDSVVTTDGKTYTGKLSKEGDAGVEIQLREGKKLEVIPNNKVKQISRHGRPILVGTVSIEKSERLSGMLDRCGIKHQVLNAKYHQREAEIIAQAGRKGAVTIATNMAGRGTDIILGGNAETMAWALLQDKYATRLDVPREEWDNLIRDISQREHMKEEGDEVKNLGGLHVIGSERHEARRIDLQLRGRCGRQGDPGSSRFFLSLEDDLMRIFAGEWVKNVLTRMGMQEGEAIESGLVTRRIEGAQKKVEERNFETRKNLLEYDEVMDEQRKRVYGFRQEILNGVNCKIKVLEMIEAQIDRHLDDFLDKDYGAATFAKWAGGELGTELDPRSYRGLDFQSAERTAKDEAERQAEGQVLDAIEENLPEDADTSEWNWEALTKFANTRWNLNLRDRELKQAGRDHIGELLIEKARANLEKIDLSEGARFLEPDYGLRTTVAWVHYKFGIELPWEAMQGKEPQVLKELILRKSEEAYDQRESEYPVMAGLYHFTRQDSSGQKRYDREQLVAWARERFEVDLDLEDLKSKQRDEIRDLLIEHSRRYQQQANAALTEVQQQLALRFGPDVESAGHSVGANGAAAGNGSLVPLSTWLHDHLHHDVPADELARLDREQLELRLSSAVEDYYRPEIRRMERALVLQLLDTAWKDHLLAMDHLRSSVGLRGYAQIDPKVEYKREGMRIFEQMWTAVGERVTDLIFRMEQLDENFVGSTWVESQATHDSPTTAMSGPSQDQQQALDGSEQVKLEPIRNRDEQIGRNDPCPCKSGKKYKNCCMQKGRRAG
ncbi:MAG TPA: SEC-C metal-binding domain-containing protein [Pirellulales bacterium]|jgi:preprotein translocase subunit SecA|nr:SEC-C metal-binding domain-containing protein [Pirellulales bacterium]